ncbi:MAG: hypothetical protein IH919_08975, partial [Deltaproteobacteria bacterium]|nr:hypothetical protein [Deltaproteobacteria bacterium]
MQICNQPVCVVKQMGMQGGGGRQEVDFKSLAEKSLRGEILTREEMFSVLHASVERLPELLDAAFRV